LFAEFVQLGQHHQRQSVRIFSGLGGDLLQLHTAVFPRLAGWDADFDDLLVGKEAHAACGGQHLAPVKMRTGDGEGTALGEALLARLGTDGVCRFLHQQGLVTVQSVERAQPLGEVVAELAGDYLHVKASDVPSSGRRGTGFAGPPASFPSRGVAKATRSARSLGVIFP
jgi:hypothetical protein